MNTELIFKDEISKILRTYKTTSEQALDQITANLAQYPKLQKRIAELNALPSANVKEINQLKKSKEYKDLVKKVRKDIYYSLRQYHLVEGHISSTERQPYIQSFLTQLLAYISKSKTIIDLGGGEFLSQIPVEILKTIQEYTWVDKDKKAFENLTKFVQSNNLKNVNLINKSLLELEITESQSYDLALMLKLIPVIKRQEKELLQKLVTFPAQTFVVTASKEAMTKKQSIEYRERKTLTDFVGLTGKSVLGEINIENEFGFVLE